MFQHGHFSKKITRANAGEHAPLAFAHQRGDLDASFADQIKSITGIALFEDDRPFWILGKSGLREQPAERLGGDERQDRVRLQRLGIDGEI